MLIFNRAAPFMHMLAMSPHGITKLARARLAERARLPSKRIRSRLALQVQQLLFELPLLARLLLRLAALILGIQRLGRAPFRREGVLFDLAPQEQHHVVPV